MDYVGEKVAGFLGVTDSRFQYVLDQVSEEDLAAARTDLRVRCVVGGVGLFCGVDWFDPGVDWYVCTSGLIWYVCTSDLHLYVYVHANPPYRTTAGTKAARCCSRRSANASCSSRMHR